MHQLCSKFRISIKPFLGIPVVSMKLLFYFGCETNSLLAFKEVGSETNCKVLKKDDFPINLSRINLRPPPSDLKKYFECTVYGQKFAIYRLLIPIHLKLYCKNE